VGKADLLTSEIITKENKDSNGDVCAGLMIIHDMEGLSYDSYNKIVKINSNPGKDLLLISPSEQVITIYKTSYQPLKLILNEIGIKLKSGEVWQIKITGDKKLELLLINIITEPSDAAIYIDNISKGKGTTFETTLGEHTLRIELNGYETLETKISVSTKNILFNYTLIAVKQEVVEIRSEPAGASIYLDGVQEGETDYQIFRYPGKYKIRLSKSGYLNYEKEIEIKKNAQNKFSFTLARNISFLSLNITPNDAEVLINNKSYGTARKVELAPGNHLMDVKKKGYREVTENITLELNKTLERIITLEPIVGSLQVRVIPIDAEVILLDNHGNEINRWNGAKIIRNQIIGDYELKVSLEGYLPLVRKITIWENILSDEKFVLEKNIRVGNKGEELADSLFREGFTALKKSNLDAAVILFQKTIQIKPNHYEALGELGYVYYRKNNLEKVEEFSKKALEINPHYSLALCNLASVYLEKKDYKTAKDFCQEAIDYNFREARAFNTIGRVYYAENDFVKAEEYFNKAIDLDPSWPGPYMNIGLIYGNKGDYDKVIEYCERAIKIDPNYAVAYDNIGWAYGRKGDYDKVIEYCLKAVNIDSKLAKAYYRIGWAYGHKGDYDKDIEYCEKAIKIDPNDANAYGQIGYVYTCKTEPDKVLEYSWKAVNINPKLDYVYNNIGWAFGKKNDFLKEVEYRRKAAQLGNPVAQKWLKDNGINW
jgi:tetratricopeptide (TPR) repeat protein